MFGKGFLLPTAKSIPFDGTGTELAAFKNVNDAIINAGSFGGGFNYGESEAESATSSTTFIEKYSLSVTDLVAGDYLLSWTTEVKTAAGASKSMEIRIQADDTTVLDEIFIQNTNNEWDVRSGFRKLTLTSGMHQLDVDFRSVTGLASIKNTRLSIWRVSN